MSTSTAALLLATVLCCTTILTVGTTPVDGQHVTPTVPTMPPHRLLGCFSDPKGYGLSWTGTGYYIKDLVHPINQTAHCLNYCNFFGTRFAALNNNTCSCGVIYYPHFMVSNSSCNYTCTDGPACGGPGFASLYQLPLMPCGLDPTTTTTTTTTTPTTTTATTTTTPTTTTATTTTPTTTTATTTTTPTTATATTTTPTTTTATTTTTPTTTTATTTTTPTTATATGAARQMDVQEYVYDDINIDYNFTSDRYYQFGDYCFRFEAREKYLSNWTAAQSICQSEGGNLVSIHNIVENNFVMSLAWSVGGEGHYPIVWGGGIDYHSSVSGNGFQWVDGTPMTYTNWRTGEPNSNSETCVEMFSNYPEPWKGSWNDVGCGLDHQFICKRPSPPPAPTPEIEFVKSSFDYACVSTNNSVLDTSENLVLWYSLDRTNYNVTGNSFVDLSGKNHVGDILTLLPDGSVSTTVTPTFVSRGGNNDALFLNKTSVISTEHSFDIHASVISISCWTLQETNPISPQSRADIITKYTHSFGGGDMNIYSLYISAGNSFCFMIGKQNACAIGTVVSGVWQHVAAVFTGSDIAIYVDGQIRASISIASTTLNDDHHQPLVIGGRHNTTTVPQDTSFKGLIDDVRVYSEILTSVDVSYLAVCALGTPMIENGIVYAYESFELNLNLYGRNLKEDQQLGFVAGPTCVNASIDYVNFPPIFIKTFLGSDTSAMLTFPAAQITSMKAMQYNLCVATSTSTLQYSGDAGFDVIIARFDTLNGKKGSAKVTVADANAPVVVSVGGMGFSKMQTVLLSQTTSCVSGGIIASWNATSSTTGTISFVPMQQTIISDVFYVCWLSGVTNTPQSYYFVSTGLSIDLDGPGYNFKRMASNDGSMFVNSETINSGSPIFDTNYFLPCKDANTVASDANGYNVYLAVTMGSFVDYLIPNANVSACDMLLAMKTYNRDTPDTYWYSYSKISPLSNLYEAEMRVVTAASWGRYGGSGFGYTTDGRTQLSTWGSIYRQELGGCCQSTPGEYVGWNQPYTITVWGINSSHVFLKLEDYARFVYFGDTVRTSAKIVDVRGNTVAWAQSGCRFVVTINGVEQQSVSPANCAFDVVVSLANTSTATVNVLAYVDSAAYELRNPGVQSFTINAVRPPTGATPIVQGNPVTSVLAFVPPGLPIGPISVPWISTYGSFFPVGDANVKPIAYEPMTAYNPFYWPQTQINYTWTPFTDMEGRFGGGTADNMTVQFFAFALFSSSSQPIVYHTYCGDFCQIYIDGSAISLEVDSYITVGWHQVVAKIQNQYVSGPGSGFALWFSKANGIASAVNLPFNVPGGATPAFNGEPFTTYLTPKNGAMVAGSMADNVLVGNGVPDASVYPTRALGTFKQVDNLNGLFPVTAVDDSQATDISITYYSLGVYSTYAGTASFNMKNIMGSAIVFFNGAVASSTVFPKDGNTIIFGVKFNSGWNQVLVKLSASAETGGAWTPGFSMYTTNTEGTTLYYAPEIPATLPSGVTDFTTSVLGAAMGAYSVNNSMYQIPFNFSSTTNPATVDASYSDFNTQIVDIRQDDRTNTTSGIPFYWSQLTAADKDNGIFANSKDSGGYNRYYSFALYASSMVYNATFSAAFNAGFSMWVDGVFIGGSTISDNASSQLITVPTISSDYHEVFIKVQAANSMKLVSIPSDASHKLAGETCAALNMSLCSTSLDVCPLGYPRPGFGMPFVGDQYAAYGVGDFNIGSTWVGVGQGNHSTPCHRPEYNQVPIGASKYAACCGLSTLPSFFSLAFSSMANGTGARLGWISQRVGGPATPAFDVQQFDGYTTVSITTTSPGAQIFYSLNLDYPTTPYKGTMNFTHFAFLTAIVTYKGLTSPVGSIVISDPHRYYVSRTNCSAGTSCIVQISKRTTPAAAYLAVLVGMPATDKLLKTIVNSSFYVLNNAGGGSQFSKMMKVSDRGMIYVEAPLVNATLNARVVLFPPGADRFDVAGILLEETLTDAPFVFPVSTVNKIPNAPLATTGGFVGGDLYAFPQALGLMGPTDPCDFQSCFNIMSANPTAWQYIRTSYADNLYVNISNSYAGTKLTCMCYAGVGGTSLTSPQVMALYGNDPVSPITVNIDIVAPTPAANSASIMSYGPDSLAPGGTISVVGYFRGTTASSIVVALVCSGNVSECSSPMVTLTTMSVVTGFSNQNLGDNEFTYATVTASVSNTQHYGIYTLSVVDSNQAVPLATNVPQVLTALVPNAPVVTGADGDCPVSSLSCTSGAIITFYGTNFVPNPRFNYISFIDSLTDSASTDVHCWVETVSLTSLTCRLYVDLTANFAGKLALDVVFYSLSTPWVESSGTEFPFASYDTHSSIVLNDLGGAGWSGRMGPPETPQPTGEIVPSPDDDALDKTTIIIAGVCGGVILILLVVGAIACIKYKFVPKAQAEDELADMQSGWRGGDENVPYSPIQADDA